MARPATKRARTSAQGDAREIASHAMDVDGSSSVDDDMMGAELGEEVFSDGSSVEVHFEPTFADTLISH